MEDLVVSTALNHSGSFGKNFAKLKTNKYIIYRLRIGSYGEKLWPRSQFFTTRTSQPANNIYLYMTCTALHVSYVVIYQAKIPVWGPYLLTQPGPFKAVKPPSELKEENVMSSNRPFSRSVLSLSLKCILFCRWIFVLRNNNLLVTHLTDFRRSRMQEVVTTDLVKWPGLPQVSYSSVVHHPKFRLGVLFLRVRIPKYVVH